MSFDALAWAAKQKPGNMAAKMALLALANYANEAGEAYPSTAAIAEFGDMNHKTATAALDRLEGLGLIVDTGRKAGKSGQIKVYRLSLQSLPKTEASQKRKPPVFSAKDPQKRVTDTVREPVTSVAKATSVAPERSAASRGSKLPEDWQPQLTPRAQSIVDGWPPGRFERELRRFRDHAADKGRISKDWQAALRTWIEKADEFAPPRQQNTATPGIGRTAAAASAVLARVREERERMGQAPR